ncbi:hypothetical protein H696_06301, partial [Fonticula alba]
MYIVAFLHGVLATVLLLCATIGLVLWHVLNPNPDRHTPNLSARLAQLRGYFRSVTVYLARLRVEPFGLDHQEFPPEQADLGHPLRDPNFSFEEAEEDPHGQLEPGKGRPFDPAGAHGTSAARRPEDRDRENSYDLFVMRQGGHAGSTPLSTAAASAPPVTSFHWCESDISDSSSDQWSDSDELDEDHPRDAGPGARPLADAHRRAGTTPGPIGEDSDHDWDLADVQGDMLFNRAARRSGALEPPILIEECSFARISGVWSLDMMSTLSASILPADVEQTATKLMSTWRSFTPSASRSAAGTVHAAPVSPTFSRGASHAVPSSSSPPLTGPGGVAAGATSPPMSFGPDTSASGSLRMRRTRSYTVDGSHLPGTDGADASSAATPPGRGSTTSALPSSPTHHGTPSGSGPGDSRSAGAAAIGGAGAHAAAPPPPASAAGQAASAAIPLPTTFPVFWVVLRNNYLHIYAPCDRANIDSPAGGSGFGHGSSGRRYSEPLVSIRLDRARISRWPADLHRSEYWLPRMPLQISLSEDVLAEPAPLPTAPAASGPGHAPEPLPRSSASGSLASRSLSGMSPLSPMPFPAPWTISPTSTVRSSTYVGSAGMFTTATADGRASTTTGDTAAQTAAERRKLARLARWRERRMRKLRAFLNLWGGGPTFYITLLSLPIDKEDWFYSLRRASRLAIDSASALYDIQVQRQRPYMETLVELLAHDSMAPELRWFNALLGRVFCHLNDQGGMAPALKNSFNEAITRKLTRSKVPSFIKAIKVDDVTLSGHVPVIVSTSLESVSADGQV